MRSKIVRDKAWSARPSPGGKKNCPRTPPSLTGQRRAEAASPTFSQSLENQAQLATALEVQKSALTDAEKSLAALEAQATTESSYAHAVLDHDISMKGTSGAQVASDHDSSAKAFAEAFNQLAEQRRHSSRGLAESRG